MNYILVNQLSSSKLTINLNERNCKMENNFLRNLSKSETDATKQAIAIPPSLSMHNDGNLYAKDGDAVTPLGAVVEVIILGITPKQPFVNTRKYFDVPYDPTSKDQAPPVCASPNGVAPYDHVPAKQAATCAECSWSQPGSGGTERAQRCGSFKIVMMVLAQQPQMRPLMMQVPVTALKSLSAYISEAQTTEVDIGAEEKITLPLAVYKCQIVRDAEVMSYAKPKFVFTGKYLEDEADCVYTTQLACKLDKEERQEQLAAPPAQIEAPAVVTTPLVDGIVEYVPPQSFPVAPVASVTNATFEAPIAAPVVSSATPPTAVPAVPAIDVQAVTVASPFETIINAIISTDPSKVGTIFADQPELTPLWEQCTSEDRDILITKLYARQEVLIPPSALPTAPVVASSFLAGVTDKSQLPELLTKISKCEKQQINDCRPLFIQVANQLIGEVYNPDVHGKSGITGMRDYPALTKAGGYKNKRGAVTRASTIAPPGVPLVNPVTPPVTPPVTAGGNAAINKVLSGLQNLGT